MLLVAPATARAWGGHDLTADLSTLPEHCDGLALGAVAGFQAPAAVGSWSSAPREFPDNARVFDAVRVGQLTAGWTTTADPAVPPTWSRWPTANPR